MSAPFIFAFLIAISFAFFIAISHAFFIAISLAISLAFFIAIPCVLNTCSLLRAEISIFQSNPNLWLFNVAQVYLTCRYLV
jgi:hypothetical protein